MQCCGTDHDSLFCTICGKRLARIDPTLKGLLFHCRKTSAALAAAAPARHRQNRYQTKARIESLIKKNLEASERWKIWGDLLEELLRQAEIVGMTEDIRPTKEREADRKRQHDAARNLIRSNKRKVAREAKRAAAADAAFAAAKAKSSPKKDANAES